MFFGVASLGAVNTTANPMYGAEELARQLRDSRASFVVTIPMLAERAREAAARERRPLGETFFAGAWGRAMKVS